MTEAREVGDDVTEELARARDAGYEGGRSFALALARVRATLAGATEGMLDIRYGDGERRAGEEEFLTLGEAWVAAHAEAPLRDRLVGARVSCACDDVEKVWIDEAEVGAVFEDDATRYPVYARTHEGEHVRLGHVIKFPEGDLTPVVDRPDQSAFYGRATTNLADVLRLFRARRSL